MTSDGIFLLRNGKLEVLEAKGFEAEAILQEALAQHPEVIAGQATVGGSQGRLLLISREVGVPVSASSGDWFSADHVFIDADAVPVIVETKRSSDTRTRREVVAQLLEYAANGTKYWSIEHIQGDLSRRAEAESTTVEALLSAFNPELDADQFWERVASNLSAGRIRLVIVADRLSPELERIIEFLNEQLLKTELLGVELRHYTDGTQRVLVPRVVGKTNRAMDVKDGGQWWDESSFMSAAASRCPLPVVELLGELFTHVKSSGGRLNFGRAPNPGVTGWYPVGQAETPVWTANTGTGEPGSNASVYLWPVEELLTGPSASAFTAEVRGIPTFAPSKGKSPSARLAVLAAAPSDVAAFVKAIDTLLSSMAAA